jgi:hypothetical protein
VKVHSRKVDTMSPDVKAPPAAIRGSSAPGPRGRGEVKVWLRESGPGKWMAVARRRWPDERGGQFSCEGRSMTEALAALEAMVAGMLEQGEESEAGVEGVIPPESH